MDERLESSDAGSANDPVSRAEVERRVGRNLLVYQEIENTLKGLLFGSLFEGTTEDFRERLAKRVAKVQRMNLGDVAKAVFAEVFTRDPKERPEPAKPLQPWARVQLMFSPPADRPDAFEPFRQRCKSIVTQRNELVHHFLMQWKLDTETGVAAACHALDAQLIESQCVRDEAMAYLRAQEERRRHAASLYSSPELARMWKEAIALGKVIDVLMEVAAAESRADGWTLLTTARNRLHLRLPLEVQLLKERLGRNWLREAMAVSSESFEAKTEPLPNGSAGSTRIVYRVLGEP